MARTKQTARKAAPVSYVHTPRNMSRRVNQDRALYARYERGDLDSDLNFSLKASTSEEGVKVSKSALIELSAVLGDMADRATDSVLVIEELSREQLQHLVAAMYGKPLRATCSVADVRALSHFAHKYDVSSLEPALVALMPYRFETSQAEELLQLYQSVPGECSLLQDAILECILRNYERVDKPAERLAILPKHLNTLLLHLKNSPPELLAVMNLIVDKVSVMV